MPPITVKGRTTRSFYRNVSSKITNGNIPNFTPYDTINDKDTYYDVHKSCRNILMSLSGGQPMKLIKGAFGIDTLMQLEPLNTVCINT